MGKLPVSGEPPKKKDRRFADLDVSDDPPPKPRPPEFDAEDLRFARIDVSDDEPELAPGAIDEYEEVVAPAPAPPAAPQLPQLPPELEGLEPLPVVQTTTVVSVTPICTERDPRTNVACARPAGHPGLHGNFGNTHMWGGQPCPAISPQGFKCASPLGHGGMHRTEDYKFNWSSNIKFK